MTILRGVTANGFVPESKHHEHSAKIRSQVEVKDAPALHRVSEVRRQQGISLRSAARRMGADVAQLKEEEQETTDLRLSDLYRWQQALEVPVTDLLSEQTEPLSRPVMLRAQMVRVMKTAGAILEQSDASPIQAMAQTLVEQLVEIMPELAEVSPWHTVGQRRSLDDYGQAFDRRLSDDMLPGCLAE